MSKFDLKSFRQEMKLFLLILAFLFPLSCRRLCRLPSSTFTSGWKRNELEGSLNWILIWWNVLQSQAMIEKVLEKSEIINSEVGGCDDTEADDCQQHYSNVIVPESENFDIATAAAVGKVWKFPQVNFPPSAFLLAVFMCKQYHGGKKSV